MSCPTSFGAGASLRPRHGDLRIDLNRRRERVDFPAPRRGPEQAQSAAGEFGLLHRLVIIDVLHSSRNESITAFSEGRMGELNIEDLAQSGSPRDLNSEREGEIAPAAHDRDQRAGFLKCAVSRPVPR